MSSKDDDEDGDGDGLHEESIIIDGANLAYYRSYISDRSSKQWKWENIEAVVQHCLSEGVRPKVIVRHSRSTHKAPATLREYLLYAPTVDGIKDGDDTAVINFAMRFDTKWISNDNFRDL